MNVIDEVKNRLQKYSHLKQDSSQNSITVFPTSNNGFTVSLFVDNDQTTVSFNGWHEEFTTAEETLNCFAFGLSDRCRLKEFRFLGQPYKWVVESRENGEWVEDSTTGLLVIPFWRLWQKPDVRYLQNDLMMNTVEQDI